MLVIDIKMPKMDGIKFFNRIEKEDRFHGGQLSYVILDMALLSLALKRNGVRFMAIRVSN